MRAGSMAGSNDRGRRMAPVDLLQETPAVVRVSRPFAWFLALSPFLIGNALLAFGLCAVAQPLGLLAVVTFAGSSYLWWPRLASRVVVVRAGLPLERLHDKLVRRRGVDV